MREVTPTSWFCCSSSSSTSKKELLTHWRNLSPDQPLRPVAVAYKHEGSTYACDGIRITGDRDWIDAVLSRLKDLLPFENTATRFQVSYQEATDKDTRHPLGSYACYVQVHRRGGEAVMANEFASAIAGRGIDVGIRWIEVEPRQR